MYARDYGDTPGSVKAFEEAFAKEEFLKRAANVHGADSCTGYDRTARREGPPVRTENSDAVPKRRGGLPDFFGQADNGDKLLLLLMVFFLLDGDTENDALVPLLLAVLFFT